MTVAIDGPAGTGKSTIARRIASDAGLFYLNSGNFYRAVTWAVLEHGVDPTNTPKLIATARSLAFEIEPVGIRVNGRHLTGELREHRIDELVAGISAVPAIRDVVNAELRRCAREHDIIAEGRDMTTVVFPDAAVRIYLDASLDSRARRRHDEAQSELSLNQVRAALAERDRIDATKPVGALKLDPSALYIDSSNLTVDQVCEIVLHTILRARTKSTTTGAIG